MKLLIGGSPCTYWSIAQTKKRETEASGMGWELFLNYVIARDKFAPDFILYENNKSMSAAIREQITKALGVEPICINSALVSAQNRKRLYWVGRRGEDGQYHGVDIPQPEDRGILLRDVLESGYGIKEKAYTLRASAGKKQGIRNEGPHQAHRNQRTIGYRGVLVPVTPGASISQGEMDYMVRETRDGRNHFAFGHFSDANSDKASALTASMAKGVPYNVLAEPMMRVSEGTAQGYCDIGPGECVDLAMENSKTRRGRRMAEKSNCLTKSCSFYEYLGTLDKPVYEVKDGLITIKGKQYPIKLRDGCYIIRKMTVTECKRLQTVPDWYEFPVSNTQAYKMLGNGWTVDVIVHLLSYCEGLLDVPVDVLSMYDGMACGHIALDKLGAHISRYYATEIDKYAIKTAQHNFPGITQLGDAFQVRGDTWEIP